MRLALIDGSGFLYRFYYAGSPLEREDGFPVGALRGLCYQINQMVKKAQAEGDPTHMAVVLDAPGPTFRHEIYPKYKAHRPPRPEDLTTQLGVAHEAVEAFGVTWIKQDGFEADDLIATYANKFHGAVTIISSDKDLMQLVSDRVSIYDPIADENERDIGIDQVIRTWGVKPSQMIDLQALAGDTSDNVPGAPRIGKKIAADLINRFGDLDNLLLSTHEITQKARRQSLEDNYDQVIMSRDLVTLRADLELPVPMDDLELKPIDETRLRTYLRKMEFNTLENEILEAA